MAEPVYVNGAPVVQSTVTVELAWLTVRVLLPLDDAKLECPPKLAAMAFECVPAVIPARLTPVTVAAPEAFVVAEPAGLPLRVKAIVLPLMPTLSEALRSVADKLVEPP